MVFKFKKEKEVIELIKGYMDKVEECLETGIKTLEAYLDGRVEAAEAMAREEGDLESAADRIRLEIRDKLYSGAYLPAIREDIYRLVESIDKVANAGEACCDLFIRQRPTIPEELKAEFSRMVQGSLGIITPLKMAVHCYLAGDCAMDMVRKQANEVGLQESVVDKGEKELTQSIFASTALDVGEKIYLKQCLDAIVEVSDRAEDAADQLDLVTLKTVV